MSVKSYAVNNNTNLVLRRVVDVSSSADFAALRDGPALLTAGLAPWAL